MGSINVPREERMVINEINIEMLDKLTEQCLSEERPDALRSLRLECCGPYLASRFREFKEALAAYKIAKAARKREDTERDARRAARNLMDAVRQMKHRVEVEEKEEQRFYIEDQIRWPLHFSERMSAHVHFRWRKEAAGEWMYGSITFTHEANSEPDYRMPLPSRKASPAKLEIDRQDRLSREWEHLMRLGLESVKEYFVQGGDGDTIPHTYEAKVDPRTRGLNNFSADFWRLSP